MKRGVGVLTHSLCVGAPGGFIADSSPSVSVRLRGLGDGAQILKPFPKDRRGSPVLAL
jgi:hypothetical protein